METPTQTSGSRYVIVTPVKDEEKHLETTIQSVLRQTKPPARWIVVDDGSQDKTHSIALEYSRKFPWITVVKRDASAARQPGPPVVQAFRTGYDLVRDSPYDFIVKLDGDLDLPADYFEKLIARFEEDKSLGIASGVYLEKGQDGWVEVKMPEYHAAGASKVIRAQCFRDIDGFVPVMGWDTIDEIRAQMAGWKTCHYKDLKFYHLRREGSGIGFLHTNLKSGEGYYRTGGGLLFFLLKVAHRTFRGRPLFLGAGTMLLGYLKAWATRTPLLVSDSEAKHYRQLLNKRITEQVARLFAPLKLNF